MTPRRLNSRTASRAQRKLPGVVDVDDYIPLVDSHFIKGCILLQTGVVDQNVDGTKFLKHFPEHALYLFFAGNISLVGICAAAAFAYFSRNFIGLVFAAHVIDHDIGSGLTERDLTLAVALRLAGELRARGHAVRLTREDGEGRALTDRTAIANRLEAKVFVSLHANASTFSSVRGSETYYMSLDDQATDEASAALAELENEADGEVEERSDLDLILWDLAQASVLNESAELALKVQIRLNALLDIRDRGIKQAPFVVLTGATMPAILVEVGFLSNTAEASRLASPEHQQALAGAIATGIDAFLRDR